MKKGLAYQLSTFRYAFNGLKFFCRSELKARIHLIIAGFAICLGVYLNIGLFKWMILTLTIALVINCEIINTALELLVDKISPEYDAIAGRIKDLAASAVLISAIAALISGCLIFIPELL